MMILENFDTQELDLLWDAVYGRRVECSRASDRERFEKLDNLLDKVTYLSNRSKGKQCTCGADGDMSVNSVNFVTGQRQVIKYQAPILHHVRKSENQSYSNKCNLLKT